MLVSWALILKIILAIIGAIHVGTNIATYRQVKALNEKK